jgi:hypothetical protein
MTFLSRIAMLSNSRKFGRYPKAKWARGAVETIQASIPSRVLGALLVMVMLSHPSQTFAAISDLDTVLTPSRQRVEKLDYRVTGRLTRVEGDGKRTNYKLAAKARWFPDGLRVLSELTAPNGDKTILLVHLTDTGHMTIEAQLPGEKTVSVVPYEHWSDPLVGTDFSYEDMVESQFFWKRQELLAPEKYGARDCFVLKSTPGAQERSHYDSVTSWIDRKIMFPVHVVKTVHGTGQQKDFVYYGLREVGGEWSATQVEAKQPGKTGSSIMVIDRGTGKANLAKKDFEIAGAAK